MDLTFKRTNWVFIPNDSPGNGSPPQALTKRRYHIVRVSRLVGNNDIWIPDEQYGTSEVCENQRFVQLCSELHAHVDAAHASPHSFRLTTRGDIRANRQELEYVEA